MPSTPGSPSPESKLILSHEAGGPDGGTHRAPCAFFGPALRASPEPSGKGVDGGLRPGAQEPLGLGHIPVVSEWTQGPPDVERLCPHCVSGAHTPSLLHEV